MTNSPEAGHDAGSVQAEATLGHVAVLVEHLGQYGVNERVAAALAQLVIGCPEEGKSSEQMLFGDFMATERGKSMAPKFVGPAQKLMGRGFGTTEAFEFALGTAVATDAQGEPIRAPMSEELCSKKKSADKSTI